MPEFKVARDTGDTCVFRAGLYIMGSSVRYNICQEKESIFYESTSFVPSAYRSARNNAVMPDLIFQICMAALSDLPDNFYRIKK